MSAAKRTRIDRCTRAGVCCDIVSLVDRVLIGAVMPAVRLQTGRCIPGIPPFVWAPIVATARWSLKDHCIRTPLLYLIGLQLLYLSNFLTCRAPG